MKSKVKSINGCSIPALGLGTWKMRGEECEDAVRKGIEIGYRHIDTAIFYENEARVGQAIGDFPREELFLTTKVWKDKLRYRDFKRAAEGSLERLGTEYLDLLLIHWPNPNVPLEETVRAMDELVEEGKVRHLGVSNFDPNQLEEARTLSDQPIVTDQVEYHLGMDPGAILDYCRDHEVFLTAYSPLGQGRILDREPLVDLADKYGRTAGQIALKWLVEQENVLAIPKASSEAHLRENIQLFDWELEKGDRKRLNQLEFGV